jgi:hypothetical protein
LHGREKIIQHEKLVRNKKACASNNKLQAQKNLALGEVSALLGRA